MRQVLRSMVLVVVTALFGLAAGSSNLAQTAFEVTIHNLTRGQLNTPPVVLVHDGSAIRLMPKGSFTSAAGFKVQAASIHPAPTGATGSPE